jgi:predicted TIM-barrel fold metal-dependent hydrolase
MIIDFHAHIGKTEKINRSFTFDSFLKLMDKNDISQAVVMPNLSSVIKTSLLNSAFMKNYNNLDNITKSRFYPFIVIDPNDFATFDQIKKYSSDIYGLKYHPSISTTPINNEKLTPFLQEASKRDLLVLVHCGRHIKSHVSHLIDCAKNYLNVTFIAAHMGGNASDLIEEAIKLITFSKCDNIYLDTSAVKLPWLIDEGVKAFGTSRLLFGSDEPYSDLRIGKYCVELSKLNIPDMRKIFYSNASLLLGETG